jgi:hypothetical protein
MYTHEREIEDNIYLVFLKIKEIGKTRKRWRSLLKEKKKEIFMERVKTTNSGLPLFQTFNVQYSKIIINNSIEILLTFGFRLFMYLRMLFINLNASPFLFASLFKV